MESPLLLHTGNVRLVTYDNDVADNLAIGKLGLSSSRKQVVAIQISAAGAEWTEGWEVNSSFLFACILNMQCRYFPLSLLEYTGAKILPKTCGKVRENSSPRHLWDSSPSLFFLIFSIFCGTQPLPPPSALGFAMIFSGFASSAVTHGVTNVPSACE